MNKYFILAVLCFIIGGIIIALGLIQGAETVSWAVIIPPIFVGTGWPFTIGSILIFIGFILMYIGFFSRAITLMEDYEDDLEPRTQPSGVKQPKAQKLPIKSKAPARDYPPPRRTSIKTGGVVFIGPIPILWGSDKRIATMMAVVTVILVVIFLIFTVSWIAL